MRLVASFYVVIIIKRDMEVFIMDLFMKYLGYKPCFLIQICLAHPMGSGSCSKNEAGYQTSSASFDETVLKLLNCRQYISDVNFMGTRFIEFPYTPTQIFSNLVNCPLYRLQLYDKKINKQPNTMHWNFAIFLNKLSPQLSSVAFYFLSYTRNLQLAIPDKLEFKSKLSANSSIVLTFSSFIVAKIHFP